MYSPAILSQLISVLGITGDGTPMDMWDMSGWVSVAQNQGLQEPNFLTPHLIHHVNPKVKFIIILRDPVQRYVLNES